MSRLINPILHKPAPGVSFPQPEQARPAQKGQGMVEFALVLPLLLLLIFGIMELGRLMIIYTSVSAASREGARYGSAAGISETCTPDPCPYYLDEEGIRAAAQRIATLVGADILDPTYDHGPGTSTFIPESRQDVSLGDRINVTVVAQYNPILGLTPMQPFPISSTTSRTIVKEVAINPSSSGGGGGGGTENRPPTVIITSPINDPYEVLQSQTQTIYFTAMASDPEDGSLNSLIEWLIDGNVYSSCSGETCAMSVSDLSSGDQLIVARVRDSNNNIDTDEIHVFVNPPPEITIIAPGNNDRFNEGDEIVFTGAASDLPDVDLTSRIQWFDSANLIGSGGSFSRSDLPLGLHNITAQVADDDEQISSTSITIVITPDTAPLLLITSPPNGAFFALGSEIVFTGFATDAQDGNLTNSITWSYDGGISLGTGPSVSIDTLSEGAHTITASVTDNSPTPNITTADIVIYVVQDEPPVVEITSPDNLIEAHQLERLTFSATAVDVIDGNLSRDIVWLSDISGQIGTGASFERFLYLPVGNHTITAQVTDSGGLTGSDSIVITILNDPPYVTIIYPADGSLISNENVNFRGIATDPQNGLISDWIQWSSSIIGNLGTGASITTTLSAGTHNITASVADSHGATAETSIDVMVWQCPASGTTVWAYQNANFANSVTWSLTIPAGTPRPPTYFIDYLSITRPVGSNAAIASITVEGVSVPFQVNGSTFEVLDPVWSGNFRVDPENKIEVIFNFSNRPSVGSGPFILTASFDGCNGIQWNIPTVPPMP